MPLYFISINDNKKNYFRQLFVEKTQLEINATNTGKTMDRMSKEMESLKWRIRNNDLPVNNLTPVTYENTYKDKQRTSLPAYFAAQEK